MQLSKDDIAALRAVLVRGWDAQTSADPAGWSPANPAWGQCAVTALLIQEVLGGDLIRTEVDGISHYFNRLPSGQCIDLTFEQFPAGSRYGEQAMRPRAYVAGYPATERRYRLLKQRVGAELEAAVRGLGGLAVA